MNRIILLTGASSGFGRMAVPELLARGHTVLAGVRGGEQRAKDLFSEEYRLYPNQLKVIDLHMEDSNSFRAAYDFIKKELGGRVDVLINNAGYGLFGALEDITEQQVRHQMEVNFFGPMFLTRALLPFLRKTKGSVINVTSGAGLIGLPFFGAYNASKFALEGYTESLGIDLKMHGVQVCLIEPGVFKTGFGSAMTYPKFAEGSVYEKSTRKWIERQRANTFYGDPKRVVNLMVKLAEARSLPLRAPIGYDMQFLRFFRHFLPSNIRAWIISHFFNRIFA